TSESDAHAFRLLCDPGETVLVPRPSYPLFEALALSEGCVVDSYASVDFLPEGARAIIAVNPNHPTGLFLTRSEAAVLLKTCNQRGIALIADEVFADFPWYGVRPAYELCGWRLR